MLTQMSLVASALLLLAATAFAQSPFSSNVINLTPRNWRREVEESPHVVFVNICRQGWGYCQQLAPEWEKLAKAVKGTVKIAYYDTQQSGGAPPLLGEIKGTPTIRLFKPKRNQGDSNKQKIVMDYNMERKAKDMKQFLDYNMPNYIEQVSGSLDKFEEKADRNGLPKAILFTSKAKTASMTKYLSTEFRRRLLIAEVYPTKPNKALMDKYGVTDLPALIVIPPANEEGIQQEPIRYEGGPDGFTKNKLQNFLSKHALKTKVPIKKKEKKAETTGHSEF